MHRRCCWPPDSASAALLELVLDLVPQRGAGERLLDDVVELAALRVPLIRGPYAMLSKIDFGNGFGFWNTMPMRRRTSAASTLAP